MWMRDAALADAINRRHENPHHLPGVALPPSIEAVTDKARLMWSRSVHRGCPCPEHAWGPHVLRVANLPRFEAHHRRQGLMNNETAATMSAVALETVDARPYILSGPTFAADMLGGCRPLPCLRVLPEVTLPGRRCARHAQFPYLFQRRYSRRAIRRRGQERARHCLRDCRRHESRRQCRRCSFDRAVAELSRLGRAAGIRHETLNGLSCPAISFSLQ
jgi:glycerol-3-phosphate dehydrogenase (NAD(P)+)